MTPPQWLRRMMMGRETPTATGTPHVVMVDGAGRIIISALGPVFPVDVTDRAARLLGIVYGDTAQLAQQPPGDGISPGDPLETTNFLLVYDPVADDWNRWIEGGTQGVPQVEDTGVNTNPERYIHDNAFRSDAIQRAGGVATALYTIATTPARTAGLDTDIWWIWYNNRAGAIVEVWLEAPGGTVVTNRVRLDQNESILLPVKPLPVGDNDILVNATLDDVEAQIGGIEV